MKFESTPSVETEKKSVRERLVFPHVEPILSALEKESEAEGERFDAEGVKDILYGFIEQRIEKSGVYVSEKHKAAFPWGMTDTAELAKKLYAKYAGENAIQGLKSNDGKKKKEFVFTSLQTIQSGSQFAFMEEALHQAVKALPGAFVKLKKGEEPDSSEVYTLGSPTNELGTMSEEFLAEIKNGKEFDGFGALYSECIESFLSKTEQNDSTTISLYGQSMGASFAASTADQLLKDNAVTQSREEGRDRRLPFLQIRLDMPVGSSAVPEKRKKWQIPVGFAIDTAYTMATDPYIRGAMMHDREFLSSAQEIFAERGIVPQLSDEQIRLKKSGIKEMINGLRKGTPIPDGLKVTKVVGEYDTLMYPAVSHTAVKRREEEYGGSLGERIVSGHDEPRTFAVKMRHTMPYLRKNELKRLRLAAEALKQIGK